MARRTARRAHMNLSDLLWICIPLASFLAFDLLVRRIPEAPTEGTR